MTDDEDAEEQFLEESRSIMKQFVLCMDNDTDLLDRSPEERDRMTRFHKQVPVDDKAKQVSVEVVIYRKDRIKKNVRVCLFIVSYDFVPTSQKLWYYIIYS